MNNRWCIISVPRSGSTWLEHLIYYYWKPLNKKAVHLTEPLQPEVTNDFPFELGIDNYITRCDTPRTFSSMEDLLQKQLEILTTANEDQPVVFKVFTESRYFSYEEYMYFFREIQKKGYKFISLYRDPFEKTISNYFMIRSGIVHRYQEKQGSYLVTAKEIDESYNSKIDIDINQFIPEYEKCIEDGELQDLVTSTLDHIKINYDSLIVDCMNNGILIDQSGLTTITKTYEIPYKDKISEDSWNKLMKIRNMFGS